jgi:hypothetical protein
MSTRETESETERAARLLLSKANLLRVRGQPDAAIEACAEALQLSPLSGDASALLADIYESQGRLDDALQWYGMAVDHAPDNPSYREHLRRLADKKQTTLVKQAEVPSPKLPGERTLELEASATKKTGQAARVVWIVCGVLALLLLLTALFVLVPLLVLKRRTPETPAAPLAPPAQTRPLLTATPMPALAPALPTPASLLPTPTPPQAAATPAPASEAGEAIRLSDGVAYLNLASGLALRDAPPQDPTSREALVRQALHLAAEVSHADARVKLIQITLKAPGTPTPALIAEIGAFDAIRVSEAAPVSDLTLVFKSLRWPENDAAPGR